VKSIDRGSLEKNRDVMLELDALLGATTVNTKMLPHFPKSHEQMAEIQAAKLWEGLYSVSPILSQIGMRPQSEGREGSFQDEEGNIKQIDYQQTTVTTLPTILREDPDFALMFMLAYPQRANLSLVKALDVWFG
jgi:hypothetical protein